MQIIQHKKDLLPIIESYRNSGKTIGFVPTMGALHAGHMSLVDHAKRACDVVVASVFINPTQFNSSSDLAKYPRTPQSDFAMLAAAGCTLAYHPETEDLYPNGEKTEDIDLGELGTLLEAAFRPGHFAGVATVVKRLFEAVQPNKAFFGEKDFQQIMVVKRMAEVCALPVEIISCPVMREVEGLAMSSRNLRLSAAQRAAAPAIFEALLYLKSVANTEKSPEKARAKAIEIINSHPDLAVEYLEVVDENTLHNINFWSDTTHPRAFAAVFAGEVRLIDNLALS